MTYLISGFLFVFWQIVIPLIIGALIINICELKSNFMLQYIVGMFTEWVIFQVIAVPCIMYQTKLSFVTYLWCIIICVLVGMELFHLAKHHFSFKEWMNSALNRIKNLSIIERVLLLVAVLLIGFQLYHYVFYQHIDDDDARFIANAVAAWDTDSMLLVHPNTGELKDEPFGELKKDVVSPFMIFYAMLAKLVCIHPTILAHTILPVVYMIMGYMAYTMLAMLLSKGNNIAGILVIILLCFVNIWGFFSKYSSNAFFTLRLWQGKAVVAGVFLPFLMYLMCWIQENYQQLKVYLVLLIVLTAGCLLSGMGLILGTIMTGCFLFCYALQNKRVKQLFIGGLACIPNIIFGILYMIN